MDLLGEMSGAVEAGKCPIGVDQANDESYSWSAFPSTRWGGLDND